MAMYKSQSVPGLLKLGNSMPKGDAHHKKNTLAYRLGSAVDLHGGPPVTEEAKRLAMELKAPNPMSRYTDAPSLVSKPEDMLPKNCWHPRIAPAWLKHDKQVLRFYAFFQESVSERPDENCRYRNVAIQYYMEDGTLSIVEPKVENSGIPQGAFLKRHRVMRSDGLTTIGPDDFRVGDDITIYARTYHVTGCDRYTRWFFEQNGIQLADDEPTVQDRWQTSYRFNKTVEKGGIPASRQAVDAKTLTKFQVGQPPADKKFTQFLLNDRKVLRFKGYWDDHTLYGARIYMEIQYFLADNTCLINEQHCRNSGRDGFPVFMKRGPLYKQNKLNAYPGMLEADKPLYMPEDFKVGESINVWGRNVVLWDCDDFTQKFYEEYLGVDQKSGCIDVSERPLQHRKLHPPPHNGIGKPEDSLINCKMIVPKPHKQDLEKMMKLTGEVLRFECKMINGEPEDVTRRFVICFYPADDETMVCEVAQRNSGHMAGKFADKRRIVNPDTGKYFALEDFYVGAVVTIAAQPLHIIRADEHCLQYLEAHPEQYPWANPVAVASKLHQIADEPELQDSNGIDPDRLKELAHQRGVDLLDHDIITLLRRYAIATDSGEPLICMPKVLELLG